MEGRGVTQAEKSPWSYQRAWSLVGFDWRLWRLCSIALARLANTAPIVRAKASVLSSPHCHRQLKNNALFLLFIALSSNSYKLRG